MEPIVEFRNITMDFPGVRANEDVTLSIRKGEIFALVGENGAGKSTLMNILYGILTPTSGTLLIGGKRVSSFSPRSAICNAKSTDVERELKRAFGELLLLPSPKAQDKTQ